MTRPAHLGLHHSAFAVGDPSVAGFRPSGLTLAKPADVKSLDDRRGLLEQLDRMQRDGDTNGQLAANDNFRDLAFQMLTSTRTSNAFDLSQENDSLRDRYGRHLWGQDLLTQTLFQQSPEGRG